jgi:hypothetical protein
LVSSDRESQGSPNPSEIEESEMEVRHRDLKREILRIRNEFGSETPGVPEIPAFFMNLRRPDSRTASEKLRLITFAESFSPIATRSLRPPDSICIRHNADMEKEERIVVNEEVIYKYFPNIVNDPAEVWEVDEIDGFEMV